jgi:uncharacterized OB-fold protein
VARSSAYTCKHGKTYDPAKDSCPDCDSETAAPEDDQPGEGELACAEAERRGLPDGFTVEARMWEAWQFASQRARLCIERADKLADDVEMSVKLEATAAKWADTAIKAAKLGAVNVLTRERIAAADRADRAQAKAEKH